MVYTFLNKVKEYECACFTYVFASLIIKNVYNCCEISVNTL